MTDQLQLLALDQITPAKDNPRRDVGDVTELAESIKSAGIIEPLIVIKRPQATMDAKTGPVVLKEAGFDLVIGHRRLAAAKKAGLKDVPVIIRTLTETQRVEAMLIENIQRKDLDPLEEAGAYRKLLELGYSEHKLAERIGRSQSHISKRMSLLKLPTPAQKALDDGKLSLPDAYELTKLAEHPERVTHAIAEKGRNGYFRDMRQVVESELELLKRDQTAAATRAQLQSQGVKLLKDVEHQFSGTPGATRLGNGWQELNIPVAEHKKFLCHRATVVRSTGQAMYLCTDPRSHLKGPDKKKLERNLPSRVTVDQKKVKAKEEADRKAIEEATAARAKVLSRALKARVPKTAATHILGQYVADVSMNGFEVADIAAELLGLVPSDPDGNGTRGVIRRGDLAEQKLAKYVAKGTDQLWHAALAVSFALGEERFRDGYGEKAILERHLAYLKRLGHVPTPAEQKIVKAGR